MKFSIYTVSLKKKYPLQISRGIKDKSVNVFLKIVDKNITAWGESAPGKSENAGTPEIVKEQIETSTFGINNLDSLLKAKLDDKELNAEIVIKKPSGQVIKQIKKNLDFAVLPLSQKIFSDVLARNNVYLYGGAGTGKTFSAKQIAKLLDWDLMIVNCNQFTSPLELIGGQTIDGYQEGKVVKAYGNLDDFGNATGRGCVLLLDELPKIDPNTAGILNNVLAQAGEYDDGVPTPIQNAKGDNIERGSIFIMATGNSLLNEADADYEANFKQDLSLQDRFAGSTYNVVVNVENEYNKILNKQWAFIFLYLQKLREKIFELNFQSKAFVSIRLMKSVAKTYQVYRDLLSNQQSIQSNPTLDFVPATGQGYDNVLGSFEGFKKDGTLYAKTIQDSMEEFFSLFPKDQSDKLKNETDYELFLNTVEEKNQLPLSELNTPTEIRQVEEIISKYRASQGI